MVDYHSNRRAAISRKSVFPRNGCFFPYLKEITTTDESDESEQYDANDAALSCHLQK